MNDILPASAIPTSVEVQRIAALHDPVLRNLQITQCYSELSRALSLRTGPSANWCTFATWASKQAGQSIRKEDLLRMLERAVQEAFERRQAAEQGDLEGLPGGMRGISDEIRAGVRQALDMRTAVDRASQAVGRGNQKVFEEIGFEFARFLAEVLQDVQPDPAKLERFCDALRPGQPPDGQEYLRRAFRRYYRSFFIDDARARAELLLCANIEIGLHEQTRLQPEIAEALDAPFTSATRLTRRLIAAILPAYGWLLASQWLARRLLGWPASIDRAVQAWLAVVQLHLRKALTESLMTIQLPPGLLVRLGDDLSLEFPETLRQLSDPDLNALLAQLDPTPDSPLGSGALDWADLPDRLHFIADLFRCYQEALDLFEPPFTPEQVDVLKSGRRPGGRL